MSQSHRRTEQQLNEDVRRHRDSLGWALAIIHGSRDAVFISDQESRFVRVNPATTDLTGYSRDEILDMRIPDLHEGFDLNAYLTYHAKIMSGRDALTEAEILRKDGSKVPVEFNNRQIEILGKPYMHTIARDLTENGVVVLEIADDGKGIEAEVANTNGGMGILEMKERASAIGAALSISSPESGGTLVRLSVGEGQEFPPPEHKTIDPFRNLPPRGAPSLRGPRGSFGTLDPPPPLPLF